MKNKTQNKKNLLLIKKDKIGRTLSIVLAWSVAVIFFAIIAFVLVSAIPAFSKFSFDDIFGTTDFNLSKNKASIWMPLLITILVTFGAVLLATPIGIKTATFIKFRLSKRTARKASIIVQTLAGIPSVVFGIFALQSLGKVTGLIFGIGSAYNIINAIIMLTFMIIPTVVSLTLSSYNGISDDLLLNPISLGLSRTGSIYKVYKKRAKQGIVVAVIIATGRAIGETMALSMILSSDSFDIINSGFLNTLKSGLSTLGALIASNMFSESGGAELRGVLYIFGIILFIIVIFLNGVVFLLSKNSHKNKNKRWIQVQSFIYNLFMFIPKNIAYSFRYIFNKKNNKTNIDNIKVSKFIKNRIRNNHFINIESIIYIILEYLCAIVVFGFLTWISIDIIINGLYVIFSNSQYVSIFQYEKDTTGQALINTILIIITSLIVSFPISLMVAIYLNEYSKNRKVKNTILFFVDSLGGSPSIIFGMFGLAIFIETFGFTSGGTIGKSLIAGAFTISIVILPTLIRTIQQSLQAIPNIIRENAYSLGCSKWQTIWTVIIPQASKSLVVAIVLSVGRIMAETAPLYLTAGLSSASQISLLNPGQTLTTRIYAQMITSNNLDQFNSITYECAFVALVLIMFLIYIANVIVPNYKKIINDIKLYFEIIKSNLFQKSKIKKNIIDSQKIGNKIYLTHEQAKKQNINEDISKVMIFNKKIFFIKYVSNEEMVFFNKITLIKKS